MKRCTKCGESKALEEFRLNPKGGQGRQPTCRDCERAYDRSRSRTAKRRAHSRRMGARPDARTAGRDRARRIREIVQAAKSVPCTDCAGVFPPYVMDLDHLPQFTKRFNLSNAGSRSETAVLAEIAKCEAVCANCHRERTFSRLAVSG